MLLARPDDPQPNHREIVNDADGLLVNFWRAVKHDPGAVARYADNPPFESDLHARHVWLVGRRDSLTEQLEGDPDWFDARAAGWWAWGICYWIGSGWCSGRGPWQSVDGRLKRVERETGVQRKIIQPEERGLPGIARQIMVPEHRGLQKIARQRINSEPRGIVTGTIEHLGGMEAVLNMLAARLRNVYICAGDWLRVMGPSIAGDNRNDGTIGVFLDPPYADTAGRQSDLYAVDCTNVAHAVREWAIDKGRDKRYRIILAGYAGEHDMPDDWFVLQGKVKNGIGYGNQKKGDEGYANEGKERLWCSPHCLNNSLF